MKIVALILTIVLWGAPFAVAEDLPACLGEKFPDLPVHAYTYKGKTVYGMDMPCCDQFNPVVDAECNVICAPSGGLTGHGDGKCSDFYKEAVPAKPVEKDKFSDEQ